MKKRWHNQIAVLNYITSTERFKLLFVLGIVLSLYGAFVLGPGLPSLFDSVLVTFSFPFFNIFFFSFLFLNTLNTYDVFTKKFDFYIIRLENKQNYRKELLKNTLFLNGYYILLFLLLYFSFLNIAQFGKFVVTPHMHYAVSNALYIFFYLGRYILYALLFSLLWVLLLERVGGKISSIGMIVFLIFLNMTGSSAIIESHFQWLPWFYFSIVPYDSFLLEVSYSILYLFLLECIFLILYRGGYHKRRRKK